VNTLIWPLVGSGVLRLSVGLEVLVDLAADITQVLDKTPR
jgi:cystathionine beta-lyase/cystathionine gamma-synthase